MAHIEPRTVPTHTFDWGNIKWFVTPDGTEGAGLTFGEVILLPGRVTTATTTRTPKKFSTYSPATASRC